MNVVGLDLSLTATGVAWLDGSTEVIGSKKKGMARLQELRDRIVDGYLLDGPDSDPDGTLVVVEGYAMGMGRNAQNHAAGELGGVIRLALYEAGYLVVDVPPATLKKFATGKGNANKSEMLAAAIRRLGYEGANDNEADALWLRTMGRVALGLVEASLPAVNLTALTKIDWPKVGVR